MPPHSSLGNRARLRSPRQKKIIYLQIKIRHFISDKCKTKKQLFYEKNYNNIKNNNEINNNQNDEFNIIGYNEEANENEKSTKKKNLHRKSEKFKTLSQKYNTLSNNSLSNSKNFAQ